MLTLTATPIPRTLQMAMSGLRELSTIQTPPVDRLAVRTYVMAWDDMVMREALLREHHRGGQSFIVVPRIADMPESEEWLRQPRPRGALIAAHGQMCAERGRGTHVARSTSAATTCCYRPPSSKAVSTSPAPTPSSSTAPTASAWPSYTSCAAASGARRLRAYAYLTTPADRQSSRSR